MIAYKCDICGKEMSAWLSVKIDIGAMRPETNVSDLIYLRGTKEICKDCFLGRVPMINSDAPTQREVE